MEKTILASHSDFVTQLRQYCLDNASGCIFITTSDSRSGRIILTEGRITDIVYANNRGGAAIRSITRIKELRYRFSSVQTNIPFDTSLPETDSILSDLLSSSSGNNLATVHSQATSRTATNNTVSKKDIEECLIDIIGPMGGILCEDHLYHVDNDVVTAINHITLELSADEKTAFLDALKNKGYVH